MTKVDVINDAGHGGSDPGASGHGLTEKQLTLEATLYRHKRFLELGIKSGVTRSTDTSLKQATGDKNAPRTNLVKQSNAKVCISDHFNAATSPSANGVETIHSIHSNGKFANLILDEIVKATGLSKRKAFSKKSGSKDYYYMHRNTGDTETVIVEYGFLSNKKDTDFYRIKANREKAYEAVVKAYCIYTGHPYKSPSQQNSPKPSPTPQTPKPQNTPTSKRLYRVVVGSFTELVNAQDRVKALSKSGVTAFQESFKDKGKTFYRVIAGSYSNRDNADKQVKLIQGKGFSAFITIQE